jgi:hypothetical protein
MVALLPAFAGRVSVSAGHGWSLVFRRSPVVSQFEFWHGIIVQRGFNAVSQYVAKLRKLNEAEADR